MREPHERREELHLGEARRHVVGRRRAREGAVDLAVDAGVGAQLLPCRQRQAARACRCRRHRGARRVRAVVLVVDKLRLHQRSLGQRRVGRAVVRQRPLHRVRREDRAQLRLRRAQLAQHRVAVLAIAQHVGEEVAELALVGQRLRLVGFVRRSGRPAHSEHRPLNGSSVGTGAAGRDRRARETGRPRLHAQILALKSVGAA